MPYSFANNPTRIFHFTLNQDNIIPVFLVDICDFCTTDIISNVAARLLTLSKRGLAYTSAICIINHQNGLPWQLREVDQAINEEVNALAKEIGITLITAVDLLMLVLAKQTYEWNPETIRQTLNLHGRQATSPPNCNFIGKVHHFFERLGVMRVAIEPSQRICIGDTIVIRLRDRYFRQRVESMQLNRNAVPEVVGPEWVGIQTTLQRSEVPIGSKVFLESENSHIETQLT